MHRAQHAEPRPLLEAGLVERPAAVDDLAVGAHHDVERHAFLDAVVALDDVVEHGVDVIGLGLGEEADAAEIDAQHRDFDVAGEFGGAQERAVAAEDEDQFAAFGGALVGVDHLDLDAEGTHVVGRQVHRPAVDGFGGEHAQPNAVVAQHFLHAASDLGGLIATRVHHQQDGAFARHCGPSATAWRTACSSRSPCSGLSVPRPQVQEVLDVAGWTRQRAGGDTDGLPLEFGGPARDGKHRVRAQVRVRHDSSRTDPILTDLKLRLHHRNDIRVA